MWVKQLGSIGYWKRVHLEYIQSSLVIYSHKTRSILHRLSIKEIELRRSRKSRKAFNIIYGFTKVTLRASSVQVKIKWILLLQEEHKREKSSQPLGIFEDVLETHTNQAHV